MDAGRLFRFDGGTVADASPILEALIQASRPPLQLMTVTSRNKPNQECVHLQANARVNLGEYIHCVGVRMPNNDAIPLQSYLFWFGNHIVAPETWVMVYTGPGEPVLTTQTSDKKPALVFHWNQPHTMFSDNQLVPCLIHMDVSGTQIGHKVE